VSGPIEGVSNQWSHILRTEEKERGAAQNFKLIDGRGGEVYLARHYFWQLK